MEACRRPSHPGCFRRAVLLAGLVAGSLVPHGYAGEPTEQVRSTIDKLRVVLEEPGYDNLDRIDLKRARLGEISDERIDFYTLCRRCLGRHWRDRSDGEREAFVELMTEFLKVNYANSIMQNFSDLKKVEYTHERIDRGYSVVRVVATTRRNTQHPVDYRLRKSEDSTQWEVIDITIEGASLVKNYRTQFDGIIRRSSFADLMESIRQRVEKTRPTTRKSEE